MPRLARILRQLKAQRQVAQAEVNKLDRVIEMTRPIFCTNSSESLHHSLGP